MSCGPARPGPHLPGAEQGRGSRAGWQPGYLLSVRQSTYSFSFSSRSSCWLCSSTASPPARPAGQPCVLPWPRRPHREPPCALTQAVLRRRAEKAGAVAGGAAGLTGRLVLTGARVSLGAALSTWGGWNGPFGLPPWVSDGWDASPSLMAPRDRLLPLSETGKPRLRWEAQGLSQEAGERERGLPGPAQEPLKSRPKIRDLWRVKARGSLGPSPKWEHP